MSDADEIEMEVRRRSLAVEGAMLMLIDGLATRGTISADEAEDMLQILSKSPRPQRRGLPVRFGSSAN